MKSHVVLTKESRSLLFRNVEGDRPDEILAYIDDPEARSFHGGFLHIYREDGTISRLALAETGNFQLYAYPGTVAMRSIRSADETLYPGFDFRDYSEWERSALFGELGDRWQLRPSGLGGVSVRPLVVAWRNGDLDLRFINAKARVRMYAYIRRTDDGGDAEQFIQECRLTPPRPIPARLFGTPLSLLFSA